MKIKVKDAADLIGGRIIGNPELEIFNVSKIQESVEGDLTFLYLPAYEKYLSTTKASAVIVKPSLEKTREDITYIEVEKPDVAFQSIIIKLFKPALTLNGIAKSAVISPKATIGKNVALGENVVISDGCIVQENTKIYHNTVLMDNVTVGSDTLIYPNVTLREETQIGSNVIIHSGTVLGSDGFGYSPTSKGEYNKVPQIGNVIIEDDVEIGSNVSIDRAAMGSTIIKRGTKIDNLVQIAHNVEIGENTAISSQTGIAGSTKIGKNCIFAGQVGVTGHIEIADQVIVGAQSGISKSITKSGKFFGYPAKEMGTSLKLEAHFRNLPEYAKKIRDLEKRLKELEENLNKNS